MKTNTSNFGTHCKFTKSFSIPSLKRGSRSVLQNEIISCWFDRSESKPLVVHEGTLGGAFPDICKESKKPFHDLYLVVEHNIHIRCIMHGIDCASLSAAWCGTATLAEIRAEATFV